jgi:hypothetical protein
VEGRRGGGEEGGRGGGEEGGREKSEREKVVYIFMKLKQIT